MRQIHALLNQAMHDAVTARYIRTNPLDGIKPPKVRSNGKDVLTAEQVSTLLDTVRGDRYECAYVLGVLCGLRIGEVLALRWEDVDLDRGHADG